MAPIVPEGRVQIQDRETGLGKMELPSGSVTAAFPKQVSHPQEDQKILFVPHQEAPEKLNQSSALQTERCRRGQSRPLGAQHPGQGGTITPAPPRALQSLGGTEQPGREVPQLGQAPAVLPGAAAGSWSGSPGSARPVQTCPGPERPESQGPGQKRWRCRGGSWGLARCGSGAGAAGVLGRCQRMPGDPGGAAAMPRGAEVMSGGCQGCWSGAEAVSRDPRGCQVTPGAPEGCRGDAR